MKLSMAGLGEAMVDVAQSNQKMWHDEEMTQLRAELETNKAKALIDYQGKATDDRRTAEVVRRDAAKSGLINETVNKKYMGSDAAVLDAQEGKTDAPMTNEQLAVIAQSKDMDAAKVRNDPMTGLLAGYATGDVSDKEMAGLIMGEKRLDRQEKKDEVAGINAARKLELQERGLDIRDKQVMAMISRMGSSGGGGSSKLPNDAEMVNYLVANGIFKDKSEAYHHVRQGKDKDDVAIQASIFSALSKDSLGKDPKELWKKAGEMVAGSRGPDSGKQPANKAPMQDVRVGGKVIGQASTQAEADALVKAHRSK